MTSEIVARSNAAWTAVTVFVASLTDHEREVLRNTDGWSVKDHLAHLGAWKRSFLLWLVDRSGHAALRIPEALFHADDLDAINAASRDAWADEPWERVLAESTAAHEAWMAAIATFDEATLARPLGRLTVARALPDITWEHDLEHLGWMHADLGRTPPMDTLSPEKQERDRLIAEAAVAADNVIAFGESVDPAGRTEVLTAEGWRLPDHLTHMAAWSRWATQELQGATGAAEMGFTPEAFAAANFDFAVISARIHETHGGASWEDAVATFRAAQDGFTIVLRRSTTEELAAQALWASSRNELFRDIAIQHLRQHLGWMREQVAATHA